MKWKKPASSMRVLSAAFVLMLSQESINTAIKVSYLLSAVEVDRFIRQVLGIITEEQAFAEIEAEELGEEVASA